MVYLNEDVVVCGAGEVNDSGVFGGAHSERDAVGVERHGTPLPVRARGALCCRGGGVTELLVARESLFDPQYDDRVRAERKSVGNV